MTQRPENYFWGSAYAVVRVYGDNSWLVLIDHGETRIGVVSFDMVPVQLLDAVYELLSGSKDILFLCRV